MNTLTALIIQSNGDDIKCQAGGPVDGKYVGWIMHYRNGNLHQPLLNTAAIFDSKVEAITKMEEIVAKVREQPPDKEGEG